MRILVNALSATSLAGERVVGGLVRHVAAAAPERCRWLVVAPHSLFSHLGDAGPNVDVREGPPASVHWARRALWEVRTIPRLAESWGASVVVAYSGVRLPRIGVPQVCVASNPRPLVRVPFWEPEQGVKHRLQRALYRWSSAGAAWTLYNSEHLRGLYERNGTPIGAASLRAPHGIDDALSAAAARPPEERRSRHQIVSASVWSPYKGAETLVEALWTLRERRDVPARLTLAGPWPEARYERRVRRLVDRLGLTEAVRFSGFLPRDALYAQYASARVFCLPSFTESFGLPALEAQAFGTPVVGSSTTAMPEVCGAGGVYCEPGDPERLAARLHEVLADPTRWATLSAAARENAQPYRWERCVAPLVELLEAHAGRTSTPTEPAEGGAGPREDAALLRP